VLLAMSYVKHVHHDRAEQWVNTVQGDDDSVNLATCSITELGFVRVASGSAGFAVNVKPAQQDLKLLKTKRRCVFLDDGFGGESASRLGREVQGRH
jgi:hypothetical protein